DRPPRNSRRTARNSPPVYETQHDGSAGRPPRAPHDVREVEALQGTARAVVGYARRSDRLIRAMVCFYFSRGKLGGRSRKPLFTSGTTPDCYRIPCAVSFGAACRPRDVGYIHPEPPVENQPPKRRQGQRRAEDLVSSYTLSSLGDC